MAKFVSKEYLVESFGEVVSELKDTMNEMTLNESFLNVFENKDVTGGDKSDFKYATTSQTMLMHLYITNLCNKNNWDEFPFAETEYTNMYRKIVQLKHPLDFLGNGDDSSECDSECPPQIDCEENWDDESAANRNATDDKCCLSMFLSFFYSFLLTIYLWCTSGVNVVPHCDENESSDSGYEESPIIVDTECAQSNPLNESSQFSIFAHERNSKPKLRYSSIAMCECTLIQSLDDLQASHTLLLNGHYSQSVFLSTQSVEKSLKSILSSYNYYFKYYFNLHDATSLCSHLEENRTKYPDNPYSWYYDRFQTLCERFESIGADSWTCPNPLSIRCRYFNFQSSYKFIESRYHYYVDSYPGIIYTQEVASEAYEIADEIFKLCEEIFDGLLIQYEEQL